MRSKDVCWVIVRADGAASKLLDLFAVKAVYDSQEEASIELSRLQSGAATDATYEILQSRRVLDQSTKPASSSRIQGFDARPMQSLVSEGTSAGDILRQALKNLLATLSFHDVAISIRPLLGKIAEFAVASKLGGQLSGEQSGADIRLPDGMLVEVKALVLDSTKARSPGIYLNHRQNFDRLAVLVFSPELDLQASKLLDRQAVLRVATQPKSPIHQAQSLVKVTPALLASPLGHDIFADEGEFWRLGAVPPA